MVKAIKANMNNIEIWIKNNTFRHKDFCDLIKLIDLKMEQKIKISLCFPTLNEEKTIGKSVSIMKKQLMDTVPLLDEIVVIDSDSLDNTRIIAKEAGAKVYKASECMIEEGYKKGKGENLWKALSILKGDIIVYIDSDISNITERFAYGIIGPLLLKPNVKFVKAFYQRPYSIDNHPISLTEGGRVTEILIRPLFSYFFPELAGIIQPLSGECAGYRSVFEELYYPIGYGIEVGMLIDIYQKFGLDAIAQDQISDIY